MSLKATTTVIDDVTQVQLEGSVDPRDPAELEAILQPLTDAGVLKLMIDLSRLESIGSSGLRVLLRTAEGLKRHGGGLALIGASESLQKALLQAGLGAYLKMYETSQDAGKATVFRTPGPNVGALAAELLGVKPGFKPGVESPPAEVNALEQELRRLLGAKTGGVPPTGGGPRPVLVEQPGKPAAPASPATAAAAPAKPAAAASPAATPAAAPATPASRPAAPTDSPSGGFLGWLKSLFGPRKH